MKALNYERHLKHFCFSSFDSFGMLPGRSRGCLEPRIDDRGAQIIPKVASEMKQRAPRRAFRARRRCQTNLNKEKPEKRTGSLLPKSSNHKPVLAREREARSNVRSLSQARCLRRCNNVKMPRTQVKLPNCTYKNLVTKKHTKTPNDTQQLMKTCPKLTR